MVGCVGTSRREGGAGWPASCRHRARDGTGQGLEPAVPAGATALSRGGLRPPFSRAGRRGEGGVRGHVAQSLGK